MKLDRMLDDATARRLPVVLFAEGGGGRPGDTDVAGLMSSWLTCPSFAKLAALSGLVPLVGLASGFCFAGNAALLGSCDVVIATRGSNVRMQRMEQSLPANSPILRTPLPGGVGKSPSRFASRHQF